LRVNGLDVLPVNAGVAEFRPPEKWDEAGLQRSFDINVKGPFFLVQALPPLCADQPRAHAFGRAAGARNSRQRHQPRPRGDAAARRLRRAVAQGVGGADPARAAGTVEEIARAALYFASDDSSFAVGSELILDGGVGTL